MERFMECFGEIDDPRAANASHDLLEVLFIALLACLCGARTCEAMSEFGHSKQALLGEFLSLKHGIPSHDTFSRVFRLLDPVAFERAFREFMAKFVEGLSGVVAIDGKALRGACEKGKSHMPRMMVGAFAAETRLTLAGIEAKDGNERLSALQLIELLSLKGCIVTADALHCHKEMASRITAGKGDYLLRVKNNQPSLHAAARQAIDGPGARTAVKRGKAKGGAETRTVTVVPATAIAAKTGFPGLKAIARLRVEREGHKTEDRYYLLSRRFDPERIIAITRQHWSIENQQHWVLDAIYDEDAARSRKDNAPQNLAVLRRLALNIARLHPDTKTPLSRKLQRAGWNHAFLFELISHMR